MASFKTRQQQAFEDLQVTKDELNSIGEAFKSEEFRNLFTDYINEITDPENQKLYEKEITELERQRGNDVTFIRPVPGYVIKTSLDGEKKAFINVCCNDNVKKPTAVPEEGGLHWSIPFTQAPPRDDFDNKKNTCYVFDVVFHPDTIQMAKENAKFKEMVNDTAMNAVEENFKVKLDKQNIRYPKMQFKGLQQPTVIRRKSKKPPVTNSEDSDQGIFEIPNYPYPPVSDEIPSPKEVKLQSVKKINPYTTPKYLIKQRSNIDIQDCTNSTTAKINAAIPNELVIEVELPLIKSATDVTLDITQKSLKLISEKPAKYKLDITLPYSVDEEKGNAKFDSGIKKLIITLIVNRDKHCPKVPFEMSREDSGVDSDVGSGSVESSSIDGSEDEPAECQKPSPETSEKVKSLDNLSDLIIENKVKSDEADNGYRTNKSDEFLSSDKHYSYPHFDVNILENILAFTFHTKNVEPDSIDSKFLDNDCGFHLKFSSIGSGFFPIHYAFCVKFPNGVIIDNENLNVEVWDNNVIAQVTINGCDKEEIDEYFSGVDENVLEKHSLPNPMKLLNLIQQETENINTVSTSTIEVIKFEENNVVLEIKSKNPSSASPSSPTHDDIKEENTETNINNVEQEIENITTEVKKKVKTSVDHDETNSAKLKFLKNYNENEGVEKKQNISSGNKIRFSPGTKMSPRSLSRTFSESRSDKSELKPYRGILKVGRSLSESSADDYSWCSSSVENTDPNGLKTKKTVRFSESISKKTYRTNSSILGQRKKNQRKAKSKKRAQERRASESENSEGEFDDLKKNKEQDNVFKSDDEMSETQSDVSQSDISQSDVSESDDGMPKNDKPDVMSLSKRNPHKKGGKKSARKSANTAKMAFTNNLMFDLDM